MRIRTGLTTRGKNKPIQQYEIIGNIDMGGKVHVHAPVSVYVYVLLLVVLLHNKVQMFQVIPLFVLILITLDDVVMHDINEL